MPNLDDDETPKTSRATVIRRVLVFALAAACAGGWIYTRYVVKKVGLGEACRYDMHCQSDAPRCLRQETEGEGVCSKPCEGDGECTPASQPIKCVKVELDERDERGRPLEGGYCFPQALLDARKRRARGDAGAPPPPSDSWVDVPESPGQLEGEITIERGGAAKTYEVKGSLLRVVIGKRRTIVDTSSLRVYGVDDEKRTFGASQIAAQPGEPRLTKTERRETIAGRECDVWQIEEGAKSREGCFLKGAAFVDPGGRAIAAWEKELSVRALFPLRLSEPKVVATRVEPKPLAAALFAIPKSYKNVAAR